MFNLELKIVLQYFVSLLMLLYGNSAMGCGVIQNTKGAKTKSSFSLTTAENNPNTNKQETEMLLNQTLQKRKDALSAPQFKK